MKKQTGFTLVELVIVVVILGLLAVTAIPKFLDLTDEAQKASIEGVAGGYATAVSLVRSQWEAEARPNEGTATSNAVVYDGTKLYLTQEDTGIRPGYVVGTTTGGIAQTNCIDIWNNIFQQPAQITSTFNDVNNPDPGESFEYYALLNGTGAATTCYYFQVSSLVKVDGDFQQPATTDTNINFFTYQPANSQVVLNIKQL